MELGKNIIKIRKQNNLTQDDFAEKYFVTRQTISNWENSKSYPDLETLIKISDDFNISLDILLKEDNEMIKDISKKQKNYKFVNLFISILNIVGIILLLLFAIPYIFHISSLNDYSWETCGFILILGFIPLLITNIMAYIFIDVKKKILKLLFFIPSIICLILIGHYLFTSNVKEEQKLQPVATFKCALDDKYTYKVYEEDNKLIITKENKNDKLPLSEIDTTSIDTIEESLTSYYKNHGGVCP